MDIDFLLWLQNLREAAGPVLDWCAGIATLAIPAAGLCIAAVLYWCFDRKTGIAALFAMSVGQGINNLVKVAVCADRPWVRNPLVHPSPLAIGSATGYSFPSGHTVTAATTLGSVAWRHRKRVLVAVLCTIGILLCALSRNVLGVHAPQDVLFALVESFAIVVACAAAAPALEKASPKAQLIALVVTLAACALAAAFVALKPYPAATDLVDPVVMRLNAYRGIGFVAGFAVAWWLERRLVCFSDPKERSQRATRLVCGLVVTGAVYLIVAAALPTVLPAASAAFAKGAAPIFAAVFLAPALFTWVERRGMRQRDDKDE